MYSKTIAIETSPGIFHEKSIQNFEPVRTSRSAEDIQVNLKILCVNCDLQVNLPSLIVKSNLEINLERLCLNCDFFKTISIPQKETNDLNNIESDKVSIKNIKEPNKNVPIAPKSKFDQDYEERILPKHQIRKLQTWYYLDGGWGWIVLMVSIIVNIINHGIILSFGHTIAPKAARFPYFNVY